MRELGRTNLLIGPLAAHSLEMAGLNRKLLVLFRVRSKCSRSSISCYGRGF